MWHPRQDSNLHPPGSKPDAHPLSYEGIRRVPTQTSTLQTVRMWWPSPDSNRDPLRLERSASTDWARGLWKPRWDSHPLHPGCSRNLRLFRSRLWWSPRDSNPDLPPCKGGMLPLQQDPSGTPCGTRTHSLCLEGRHVAVDTNGVWKVPMDSNHDLEVQSLLSCR